MLLEVALPSAKRDCLEETPDAIVDAAKASVPRFDHVGISFVHDKDHIETKATTSQLVWELDGLQYKLMEGPCVAAMFEAATVSAPNLRHDQRWRATFRRPSNAECGRRWTTGSTSMAARWGC